MSVNMCVWGLGAMKKEDVSEWYKETEALGLFSAAVLK